MTKKKSLTRKQPVYRKTKSPVKPRWMRVTKVVAITVLVIYMILAIIAIVMKYYQLVSNHK